MIKMSEKQNYYIVEESLLRVTIELLENEIPVRLAQKVIPILNALKNSQQAVLNTPDEKLSESKEITQ